MYPTLFEIFGFEVSTFGLMMAAGFLAGGELGARSFEHFGYRRELAWNIVIWCAVGGVVGAKLWYVVEHVVREPDQDVATLLFSRGGLTWYGGLLGGSIAGLSAGAAYRIPLLALTNMAAPTLALGQAIGRIGCLLVGDDYGVKSDLPWAIAFPEGLPPTKDPVHPTMVYETLWLAAATLWLWRRRDRSPFLFGEYLMLAGLGRLWIEIFRVNPSLIGPLSNAQVVAGLCVVAGAAGWVWRATQQARSVKQSPNARATR